MLGGTAWLSREVAEQALARGHEVVALARGESGPAPRGVELVRGDRSTPDAYADLAGDFDALVDVSRQPGQVRGALAALAGRVGHWVFVSTCSVYARHDVPGADETAELLPAFEGDIAPPESYGQAKVACEAALRDVVPAERLLVARSGLITGPGDVSDRTGYWPLRFARPADDDGAVLVPDSPALRAQVVDVRDQVSWLLDCVQVDRSGTFNTMGEAIPLADHLATARAVADHTGEVVAVTTTWLVEREVEEWSGSRSLPLWVASPELSAFLDRDASSAAEAGLVCRPLAESLADTLAWELAHDPGRVRKAGLSPEDERDLLTTARAGR